MFLQKTNNSPNSTCVHIGVVTSHEHQCFCVNIVLIEESDDTLFNTFRISTRWCNMSSIHWIGFLNNADVFLGDGLSIKFLLPVFTCVSVRSFRPSKYNPRSVPSNLLESCLLALTRSRQTLLLYKYRRRSKFRGNSVAVKNPTFAYTNIIFHRSD